MDNRSAVIFMFLVVMQKLFCYTGKSDDEVRIDFDLCNNF